MKKLILLFSSSIIFLGLEYTQAKECTAGDRADSSCVSQQAAAAAATGAQAQSANAASKDKDSAIIGQIGQMVGNVAITIGASTCPAAGGCDYPLIAAGMAAVSASILITNDAGKAGAGAYNSMQAASVNGGKDITADEFLNNLPTYGAAQKALNDLNKNGIKFGKDGSVSYNGKTLSAEDAQNAGKLGDMLGQNIDAAALKAGANSLLAKAKEKAAGYADSEYIAGGPAGKGGGGFDSVVDPLAGLNQGVKIKTAGTDRGPADVAGMKKQLGDSFIGVAGDDIFSMMKRRYDLKKNQNAFLVESNKNL